MAGHLLSIVRTFPSSRCHPQHAAGAVRGAHRGTDRGGAAAAAARGPEVGRTLLCPLPARCSLQPVPEAHEELNHGCCWPVPVFHAGI
jgi:hypothetical protein